MTTHILNTELSNLIQESKRKNADLRTAADKSLQDLKSLHATSEAQLAADLHRRPQFISPFLIACNTRNPKFAVSAVVCFQRLAVIRALPKERLKETLEAFQECSTLNLDIQLKILQALPSLLHNYSDELRGELLTTILQVCSTLQNAKNPAVSNTAAATLQQLVISIFDKVTSEDERTSEVPTISNVLAEDESIPVRPAALDAHKVFSDLCSLIDGVKSQSSRFPHLSLATGLELTEAILSNHGRIFVTHKEQASILRTVLMPFVTRSLSEKLSFPVFLRTIRIASVLIRQLLDIVPHEGEIVLGLLSHMLDPDESTLWKRALCMEVFRSVYSEPGLVLRIYSLYDAVEGRKAILRENLSSFVRISTEKPTLIGLGPQSTAPVGQPTQRDSTAEQAALEAGGVAGVISGAVSSGVNTNMHGLSAQWSTMRTACVDHLDKSEPPSIPETYIYSLVLSCINSLSENVGRFILPLTVHPESRRKRAKGHMAADVSTATPEGPESPKTRLARTQSFRKRTVPINPLTLRHHGSHDFIKAAADLIEDCWPAVLAICSTFLYAALDSTYYRSLVRSYQKFTQVAGLLRISTARDALLTTLGKSAVPSNVVNANIPTGTTPHDSLGIFGNNKGLLSVESLVSQSSAERSRRPSTSAEDVTPVLGTRNLLCLRALLNLAIALGPTLERAWSIVFETLQKADIALAITSARASREARANSQAGTRNEADGNSLSTESAAVQAAAARLFESTTDFPNESFVQALTSLCSLVHAKPSTQTPKIGLSTPPFLHQRKLSSYSNGPGANDAEIQDYLFALGRIGDLASLNLSRLTTYDAAESGWDILMKELIAVSTNSGLANTARMVAADIIRRVVRDAASESMSLEMEIRSEVQRRSLFALHNTIKALYERECDDEDSDTEVHSIALEALKAILERCGEALTAGWGSVFAVILSVFENADLPEIRGVDIHKEISEEDEVRKQLVFEFVSMKLGRSAFESVELICSDFLSAIPDDTILTLVDILFRFCSQREDLNLSLTTITFFWNVSDFLHGRNDAETLSKLTSRVIRSPTIFIEIEKAAAENNVPALWLHALLRLTTVSTDMRAEVRHGAIHTILRIFDNYGDNLSPDSWTLCIRAVMYRMTAMNIQRQHLLRNDGAVTKPDQLKSWHETTEIVLEGLSALYSNYLDAITRSHIFDELWQMMTRFFKSYLSRESQEVNAATYNSINGILSKVQDVDKIGSSAVAAVATLWMEHFPSAAAASTAGHGNQDAFVAYVRCFKEIYRLIEATINASAVEKISANLLRAIRESDAPAYSSDRDHLNPLQKQVVDVVRAIRTDIPTVPTTIIGLLSELITLPFTPLDSTRTGRQPLTFVALSKAAMPLLENVVLAHINSAELYQPPSSLPLALRSLAVPISRKYLAHTNGKPPPPWQIAANTALALAGPALSTLPKLNLPNSLAIPIWDALVSIATHVTHAPTASAPHGTPLPADEAFDLRAFSSLRGILTPGLGATRIPDQIRRRYAATLFSASLMHPPAPGELVTGSLPAEAASLAGTVTAAGNATSSTAGAFNVVVGKDYNAPPNKPSDEPSTSPLDGLFTIRRGRTFDPPPVMRGRIAYACLEELLSLVEKPTRRSSSSSSSSSEEDNPTSPTSSSSSADGNNDAARIRLARAASPYLIARAALPLKAYIADQPLRGRLPQPASRRAELLHALRRLRTLRAEPRAIPDAPGVKGKKRKHLHRLFPLVAKAVGVAGQKNSGDAEILEVLSGWVADVGDGFGVE